MLARVLIPIRAVDKCGSRFASRVLQQAAQKVGSEVHERENAAGSSRTLSFMSVSRSSMPNRYTPFCCLICGHTAKNAPRH